MNSLRALRRRLTGLGARAGEAGLAALGVAPPAVLLVLGHMRSGSTLLGHVLLTNPEIAGVGERNAPYAGPADLSRLVLATRRAARAPRARWRYVVDQVNHNHLTPGPALLAHPRLRLLFLLREPAASVASILALTREHYGAWSVERAVSYYAERLDALAETARRIDHGERAGFITYADLTGRTAETLVRLRDFLGTGAAFSERYAIRDFTGTRGDPGAKILSGRIERVLSAPTDPADAAGASLPAGEIARAAAAYARCRGELARFALLRG